jgi:hypothetical protein
MYYTREQEEEKVEGVVIGAAYFLVGTQKFVPENSYPVHSRPSRMCNIHVTLHR